MAWKNELKRSMRIAKQTFGLAEMALANTTLILQQKYPEIEATMSSDGNVIFTERNGEKKEFYSISDVEETYGKR